MTLKSRHEREQELAKYSQRELIDSLTRHQEANDRLDKQMQSQRESYESQIASMQAAHDNALAEAIRVSDPAVDAAFVADMLGKHCDDLNAVIAAQAARILDLETIAASMISHELDVMIADYERRIKALATGPGDAEFETLFTAQSALRRAAERVESVFNVRKERGSNPSRYLPRPGVERLQEELATRNAEVARARKIASQLISLVPYIARDAVLAIERQLKGDGSVQENPVLAAYDLAGRKMELSQLISYACNSAIIRHCGKNLMDLVHGWQSVQSA